MQEFCKICNAEVSVEGHFWTEHKIKKTDYYDKYYGKKDLFTGRPLEFKDREQYFSTDFNSRETLKAYFDAAPTPKIQEYCISLFKKRKLYKNLIYSPTQVELRSVISPPVNFINKHFSAGYLDFCEKLGFTNRFKYNNNFILKTNEESKKYPIFIDTREQQFLDLGCNFEIKTLNVGDYTLGNEQLSNNIYIERKSLNDFIGTFGAKVQRFENEVTRAAEMGAYLIVIVEEEFNKCLRFNALSYVSKKMKVGPTFIFHNVRELLQKFTNLQFLFVPNRAESARMVKKILFTGQIFKEFDIQQAYDLQLL